MRAVEFALTVPILDNMNYFMKFRVIQHAFWQLDQRTHCTDSVEFTQRERGLLSHHLQISGSTQQIQQRAGEVEVVAHLLDTDVLQVFHQAFDGSHSVDCAGKMNKDETRERVLFLKYEME